MKYLYKVIDYLEQTPLNIESWIISFGAVVMVRVFIENLLSSQVHANLEAFVGSILHTFLFFLFSYLLILFFLKYYTKERWHSLASILFWGQLIIIMPPIADHIIFGNKTFYSFYIFDSVSGIADRYFHFFGTEPNFGITYGTRIEVALVVAMIGIYFYIKQRSLIRALSGVLFLYTLLFFLGVFPSLVAVFVNPILHFDQNVSSLTVAKIFFTPLRFFGQETGEALAYLHYKMSLIYGLMVFVSLGGLLFWKDKMKFYALLKNIRYPQTVFNFGIFFIGLGLGCFYYPQRITMDFFSLLAIFNLLLAIFCSWFYSVFVNDLADQNIDRLTNIDRPLQQKIFSVGQYRSYSKIFLLTSLVSSLTVSAVSFVIVVVYHFATYIYSCYPYRLKRFVGVASVLSSAASLLSLFLGFLLVSGPQYLEKFPWLVAAMMFVGYALVIPLKDFKDIEGDRVDGVYTLPVLLGETNAKLFISGAILLLYFYSIYATRESTLFFPAILLGTLSYWVVNKKTIAPKMVTVYILAIAAIYCLLIAAIIFF